MPASGHRNVLPAQPRAVPWLRFAIASRGIRSYSSHKRKTTMVTVGVRELKNRLTYYLKRTQGGERVIVTDRGTPVAVLHEVSHVELDAPGEEYLAAAAAEGTVRLPLPGATLDLSAGPRPHKGTSASAIIIEDRR
jgi:prevent-host-death family protein